MSKRTFETYGQASQYVGEVSNDTVADIVVLRALVLYNGTTTHFPIAWEC